MDGEEGDVHCPSRGQDNSDGWRSCRRLDFHGAWRPPSSGGSGVLLSGLGPDFDGNGNGCL